jgi:starch synthase (maltosyl-transferring)
MLSPRQPDDARPAKAFVGEVVPFTATIFKDGHDVLGGELLLTDPVGTQTAHRLRPAAPGTDRWEALVELTAQGLWQFSVRAWTDDWASWLREAEIKVPAGLDTALVLATGAKLLHRAAERPGVARTRGRSAVVSAFEVLADTSLPPAERLAAATDPALAGELDADPLRSTETLSLPLSLAVERKSAKSSAVPRSGWMASWPPWGEPIAHGDPGSPGLASSVLFGPLRKVVPIGWMGGR